MRFCIWSWTSKLTTHLRTKEPALNTTVLIRSQTFQSFLLTNRKHQLFLFPSVLDYTSRLVCIYDFLLVTTSLEPGRHKSQNLDYSSVYKILDICKWTCNIIIQLEASDTSYPVPHRLSVPDDLKSYPWFWSRIMTSIWSQLSTLG